MPSARRTGRGLLARVVARVLIAALVFGLLPVPAQASLPAPSRAAAARLDPPADLPLRDQTSPTVLVFVSEDEELCAVLVVVADPDYPSKYHRARWMDPRTGRFTGMDPWKASPTDPSTLHRYLYTAANPLNQEDPSGLFFTLMEMGTSLAMFNTVQATSVLSPVAMTQRLQRAPLPPDKEGLMMQALGDVRDLNPSPKCQKKCIDPLVMSQGFSLTDFKTFMNGGVYFFDGTASTVPISGSIYPPQAARLFTSREGLPLTATVADLFNRKGGSITNAITSAITPKLTIFFRPSAIASDVGENAGRLFHEGLHGFEAAGARGSYDDDTLMQTFRLTGGSVEITRHLKKNCF